MLVTEKGKCRKCKVLSGYDHEDWCERVLNQKKRESKQKVTLCVDTETRAPEFVVAAAKELKQDPEYFPGKDYPDREVWLKIRAAQRQKPEPRVIYRGAQPLALGINAAKRMADAGGNPKHTRSKIGKHRHDYYRQRYEAETKS